MLSACTGTALERCHTTKNIQKSKVSIFHFKIAVITVRPMLLHSSGMRERGFIFILLGIERNLISAIVCVLAVNRAFTSI